MSHYLKSQQRLIDRLVPFGARPDTRKPASGAKKPRAKSVPSARGKRGG